jgi:hypothetical protein
VDLPNAQAAIIPPRKLRDYLLSTTHPVGRYKVVFFRSQGYSQDDWEALASDIRSLLSASAAVLETTRFGTKYAVSRNITDPGGQIFRLVTIWIILEGEDAPRFVTAYPED